MKGSATAAASASSTTRATAFNAAMSGSLTGSTTAPSDCGAGDGAAHRQFHVLVQILEKEAVRKTDAHSADGAIFIRHVIHHREARRSRVARIVAGDRVQGQRGVAHRAGQRAHVVQAVAERQHTVAAHAAVGRLQPDGPAKRRGDANRAAGIAAHGHEDHLRSPRRRPNRRSSRPDCAPDSTDCAPGRSADWPK